MQFKIEQIALYVRDPIEAKALLDKIGAGPWSDDHVVASGKVYGLGGTNEANLAFEYELLKSANELEVLNYTDGPNWMENQPAVASHFGMHCTEEELVAWKTFFKKECIPIVQEVRTISHTNPNIAHSRRYNYVIFGTRDIIGIDLKFIVRLKAPSGS